MGNTPYSFAAPEDAHSSEQPPLSNINLGEPLSSAEISASKSVSTDFVIGPDPKCHGVDLNDRTTLLRVFSDALRGYKYNHPGYESGNSGNKEKIRGLLESEATIEQAVVAKFGSLAGEFLSKPLVPGTCNKIFETTDSLSKRGLQWIDPNEFLEKRTGGTKKDSLLVWYYFETELLPKSKPEDDKTTPRELNRPQLEQLRDAIVFVLNNYQKVWDEWKAVNPKQTSVGTRELTFWYLTRSDMDLAGQKSKEQHTIIINALDFVSHGESHEIAESVRNGVPSLYNRTTIPDQLGVDANGKVVSAIEVRSYSPREFEAWVKTLERAASLLNAPIDENEKDRSKREGELALYDRQGLQVTVFEGPYAGTRLGVNTDGLHTTLNILNGDKIDTIKPVEKIDFVNPVTGEVTTVESEIYPQIILRIPQGLDKDLLSRLGEVTGTLGIRNFVVEELPFDSKEIRDLAYSMFMYRTLKVDKNSVYDPSQIPAEFKTEGTVDVMNALKDRKHWKI